MDLFASILRAHREATDKLEVQLPQIRQLGEAVLQTYRSGKKTLWCGNGGSAADAQHIAAEFVGRFVTERQPLPALALHANTSTLTAVANDYGFASIFVREVCAFGAPGDLFVGISTSGNSLNVIEAAQAARQMGLTIAALVGGDGGKLAELADIAVCVPASATARVQEMHILIGHMICAYVDENWTSKP